MAEAKTTRRTRAGTAQAAAPAAVAEREERAERGYTGADIRVLEGIEAIRTRPGMYIGSTGTTGLHHLIWEALDNATDEAIAGYGKNIWVEIDRDGWVTVRDEARGMPFDLKEVNGKTLPTATVIMTVPHSGGKFDQGAYKTAGGLHGVGATVINALSERLELTIWRDGQQFFQTFTRGVPGKHTITPCDPKRTGTQLRWLFDREIFADPAVGYQRDVVESRLRAAAYLNRGIAYHLRIWDDDAGEMVEQTFHSERGLVDYVEELRPRDKESQPLFKEVVAIAETRDDVVIEVAVQPNRGERTRVVSFANGVRTVEGGTHESGFQAALTKVLNDQAIRLGVTKKREFDADLIREGLVAIVSVKLTNPQFEGQTKNRLTNSGVDGIVRSVVGDALTRWMEANESAAREWVRTLEQRRKARDAAKAAARLVMTGKSRRNGALLDATISDKFIPCNTKDPERAELYLVEGDSAGGSASQGRFSDFQAILKLSGKPLNVARANIERVAKNEEIRTLLQVIGTGSRQAFDISRLRFHKIIIMTDADVDGMHIQALLLTLFLQELPQLIERGHIYLAAPPLYSVRQNGKVTWLRDDEALREWMKGRKGPFELKRYKGLGEMNPRELRETTMDPERRRLRRVTLEDAALAERMVYELMEDTNAEGRRTFLAQRARKYQEIDV
ncbi:type IIA DNA topoisomerase subunit B [Sphaerobacter sp.]|uniref:DNA gyrase/topoisomerase IV subunit B n=1 Tax=Sphaerobacter sp. TaxID=2099654 RepID=UPI001D66CDDA|nr:type IIA DNA topoisomerase subunit B [Sphaerobacter sp.]MBX5445598.1 type IIA DNA topoisomerase subunit B [Sphaerobacter sp.]